MEIIGTCIGTELKKLMPMGRGKSIPNTVFSCPLDEALVECTIGTSPPSETASVFDYDLAPYGSFPKSTGRKLIGEMETQPLEYFWKAMFLVKIQAPKAAWSQRTSHCGVFLQGVLPGISLLLG
jgi:imidazoleglycerol phosphate dehydratase HisB